IDLPIHTDEPIGPLADFALETTPRTDVKVADTLPPPPRPINSSVALPLFKERKLSADAPRVVPPATPRPPLGVRRSTPIPPRAVPAAEEPLLGFANEEPSRPRAFAAAASTARPEE